MINTHNNIENQFLPQSKKELILEIQLNGKLKFDVLLYHIYNHLNITYRIVNAELEYVDEKDFGQVQLKVLSDSVALEKLENYLREFRIVSHHIELIQKREVS